LRELAVLIAVVAGCGSRPAGGDDDVVAAPDAGDERVIATDCRDVQAAIDLAAQVEANAGADRGRYPLVLAHGFLGFDKVGPLEYFVGVPEALRAAGFAAYVTAVDPIAPTDAVRGPQLVHEMECIARAAGAPRLNLVGHSQGGLDVRWAAGDRLGTLRTATVTTIAAPHHGTPLADASVGFMVDSQLRDTMQQMSVAAMDGWNQLHPDVAGIPYFSWTGVTGDGDPIDPLLAGTYTYLLEAAGPNDGLVDVASAHWGEYLGTVPADHFDEVGLFTVAETDPISGFNHRQFFVDLAADLESRGY
jgi:triacylglycerol esterase/lipase EstA (alpha/beta hydrolase family)